ncbi:winged helix-turn-helix domain-containing protein [Paenibacillus tarimensis]
MRTETFTNQEARRFLLSYHGLGEIPIFSGKEGVMDFIRRAGCIQYDPLNIVGRNPELVLQSRILDFRPSMLQELLYKDRLLVDGMDKVMSIYPAQDWPYFRRIREEARQYYGSIEKVTEAVEHVRAEIEAGGPLSSDDLQLDRMVDWAWAPTRLSRAVLESMYFWGELVVHHKKNNQKVYDFASRHLPEHLLQAADPNATEHQYNDWRILRRIGGIGLLWNKSGDAWIGMGKIKSDKRKTSFRRLAENGDIVRISIQGIDDPLYARTEDLDRYKRDNACCGLTAPRASILAPLDNLLWDRRLVKAIYDFEYIWEVYKPASQRKYGYYVLPVLYGDRFVARFEPGRDKKTGALVVKNWWWEPGVKQTEELLVEIGRCFQRFMQYLGTTQIHMDSTTDAYAGFSGYIE